MVAQRGNEVDSSSSSTSTRSGRFAVSTIPLGPGPVLFTSSSADAQQTQSPTLTTSCYIFACVTLTASPSTSTTTPNSTPASITSSPATTSASQSSQTSSESQNQPTTALGAAGSESGATGASDKSSGLSGGAIAAAVVVPVIVLVAVAILLLLFLRRRKQRRGGAARVANGGSAPLGQTTKGPSAAWNEKGDGSFSSASYELANSPHRSICGGLGPLAAGALAKPASRPSQTYPQGAPKRKEIGTPPAKGRPSTGSRLPNNIVEPVSPLGLEPSSFIGSFAAPAPPVAGNGPNFAAARHVQPSARDDELFLHEQPLGRHWHSENSASGFDRDHRYGTTASKARPGDDDIISDLGSDDDGEVEIGQAAPLQRHRASVIDMQISTTPPKDTKI